MKKKEILIYLIYVNTQIYLIKGTLITYSLSFCYPFALCLLPGLFRIPSLSKGKNNEYLYSFSKLIQNIIT